MYSFFLPLAARNLQRVDLLQVVQAVGLEDAFGEGVEDIPDIDDPFHVFVAVVPVAAGLEVIFPQGG